MEKLFELVKTMSRKTVDLRAFNDDILNAYQAVNPSLHVEVYEHFYIVQGNLSRYQAVNAGRIIAKTALGCHAVRYPKYGNASTIQVFKGTEI